MLKFSQWLEAVHDDFDYYYPPSTVPCERCKTALRVPGERYCKECRKSVKQELKDAGYLQKVSNYHAGQTRDRDSREDTYATKHGTGH